MTREEAREVLKRLVAYDSDVAEAKLVAMEALSAKAIADRPTGRWKMMMNSVEYWFECSECGGKPLLNRFSKGEEHSPFCPSCGAVMEGGDAE